MTRRAFYFIFASLLIRSPDFLFCAFKEDGWGARPSGMGGAFVAVADDANVIFWNPAGSAQLGDKEISLMYGRPYFGLPLKMDEGDSAFLQMANLSAVTPTTFGTIGLGWTNFMVPQIYQENTLAFNYADQLSTQIFSSDRWQFYYGVNVKLLHRSFNIDDATADREKELSGQWSALSPLNGGDSKSVPAFDLGLLVKVAKKISVGFSVKHLNEPNIGFNAEEHLPKEFHFGLAYFASNIAFFDQVTPAFGISWRKPQDEKMEVLPRFGLESWLDHRAYGFRIGGNFREVSCGFSIQKNFSHSALQIDYAAAVPFGLMQDHFGSHRIALVWKQP